MQISTMNMSEQGRLPAYNFDSRMKLKEHDLNGIMEELQDLLPGVVPDGIEIKMDLADSELRVMTDALKLTGALLNLIGNAGDALSPGGRLTLSTRRIRFADDIMGCSIAYASSGCALVSICDTGSGMDQNIRERIFEPFFTTKEGSRGLGCTLALRIVESLNGRISVESAVDAGTDVRVYLPLIKNDLMRAIPIPLPASFSTSPFGSIYR